MSIISGYGKFKRYVLTDKGYRLCSQWTSSNTVHFDDNKTAETKLGAIDGITDSLTATNSNIALSSKAGYNLQSQINELNTDMTGLRTYTFNMPPTSDFNVMLDELKNFYNTLKPGPFEIFVQAGIWYRVSGIYAGIDYGWMIIYTYGVGGIAIYSTSLINNSWSQVKYTFL